MGSAVLRAQWKGLQCSNANPGLPDYGGISSSLRIPHGERYGQAHQDHAMSAQLLRRAMRREKATTSAVHAVPHSRLFAAMATGKMSSGDGRLAM